MKNVRHSTRKKQSTSLLSIVVFLLAWMTLVSCSESVEVLDEPMLEDATELPNGVDETQDDDALVQIYSEIGSSGMRVTYSPVSLTAKTSVEELEVVYGNLMACVGLSSVHPPAILLSTDLSLFYVREDGVDVRGFYDLDTTNVIVYADDLDESLGNKYWWTRHGMIEYLIDVHGLQPDSVDSPFMRCHWDDASL